jgi:signal transduction histidine kinase
MSTTSRRWARLAWGLWVLVLVIALAYPALVLIFRSNLGASPVTVVGELFAVAAATVGALVASRLPRNPIGWILCAAAVAWSADATLGVYAADASVLARGSIPGAPLAAWLAWWLWLPGIVLILVFVPLLFPDGRLPSARWSWPAIGSGVLVTAATVAQALDGVLRLPQGLDQSGSLIGDPSPWTSALGGLAMISMAGAVVSVIFRFRRATSDTKQQLKWFAFAASVTATVTVLSFGSSLVIPGNQDINNLGILASVLSLTGIPVSVGVAILRYRLYDIDIVISRTLVYGALAVFITAVYVAIVVGIGNLIGSGGQPNLALSIVATAVVAVAFQPVRERLQTIANRLVYGKRATPYEVLSQFSERVAESYAAADVLPRMAHVLADGTGAERAQVWLRAGATLRPAAVWPSTNGTAPAETPESVSLVGDTVSEIPEATRVVEVRHQGELLGALTVTKRQGESLTPVEEKLLDDLASQAGLVLKNVGLTAELLQRLEDLRASRQRLVAAQDEERRRLERNLHDGAQQNLVALKVKLGLAEVLAGKDPARAKALVGELKSDADEALETLRDLARGIYPPLLADKGLAAALQAQARKATVPVDVESDGTGRYPQEVEAAIYFCCLEALQNIQKYANASIATVRLIESDGGLSVEVSDDGKGFDPAVVRKGSGLQNMEDRLAAMGGTVAIRSAPGEGTSVTARIPTPLLVAP